MDIVCAAPIDAAAIQSAQGDITKGVELLSGLHLLLKNPSLNTDPSIAAKCVKKLDDVQDILNSVRLLFPQNDASSPKKRKIADHHCLDNLVPPSQVIPAAPVTSMNSLPVTGVRTLGMDILSSLPPLSAGDFRAASVAREEHLARAATSSSEPIEAKRVKGAAPTARGIKVPAVSPGENNDMAFINGQYAYVGK